MTGSFLRITKKLAQEEHDIIQLEYGHNRFPDIYHSMKIPALVL